jgi:hypothetical protein
MEPIIMMQQMIGHRYLEEEASKYLQLICCYLSVTVTPVEKHLTISLLLMDAINGKLSYSIIIYYREISHP